MIIYPMLVLSLNKWQGEKSILGKELIYIDSTATSSRSCQKRSL